MSRLALTHTPDLRTPYLIAGFGGWAKRRRGVHRRSGVPAIQPADGEPGRDYLRRPVHPCVADAGQPSGNGYSPGVDRVHAVSVQYAVRAWRCPEDGGPDLILLQGVEPDLLWQEYVEAILDCVDRFQVRRVYTIGGLPGPRAAYPFTANLDGRYGGRHAPRVHGL